MSEEAERREPAKRERRRRRRLWIALATVVLFFAAAAALLPRVASGVAARALPHLVEEKFDGRCSVGSVDLSWNGTARLTGLRLLDPAGREMARIPAVVANVRPLGLVRGNVKASVVVEQPVVHLRPGERAPIDWIERIRPEDGKEAPEGTAGPPDFSSVFLSIKVRGARIVQHDREGRTASASIRADALLDGEAGEFSFSFEADLDQEGRKSGSLRAEAHGRLPEDPGTPPWLLVEQGHLQGEGLDAELLGRVAGDLSALTLSGSVDLSAGISAEGDARMAEVRVEGSKLCVRPPERPPVRLAAFSLAGRADVAPTGAFSSSGSLRAASDLLADFEVEGSLEEPDRPWTARLSYRTELEALAALLGEAAGLQPDAVLSGRSEGRLTASWSAGPPRAAALELHASVTDALVRLHGEEPSRLAGLSPLEATLRASASGDRIDVTGASIETPALALDAHGSFDPKVPAGAGGLSLRADLDAANADLRALLGERAPPIAGALSADFTVEDAGVGGCALRGTLSPDGLAVGETRIDGAPCALIVTLAREGDVWRAEGQMGSESISLGDLGGTRDLDLTFAAGWPADLGRIRLERLDLASSTASAHVEGEAIAPFDPGARSIRLEGRVSGSLGALLADAPVVASAAPLEGDADLEADWTARLDREEVGFDVKWTASEVRLDLLPPDPTIAPVRVREERIAGRAAGRLYTADGRAEFDALDLDSAPLRADLEASVSGLDGDEVLVDRLEGIVRYVPDRVAPYLEPFAPVRLVGAEERMVVVDARGRLAEMDLLDILLGTRLEVVADVGILDVTGVSLDGKVELTVEEGALTVSGDLEANGGSVKLAGRVPPPSEPKPSPPSLSLEAEKVRFDQALSPLLGRLHPILRAPGGESRFGGLLNARVELRANEPLSLARLLEEARRRGPALLRGTIRLELQDLQLEGSPFLRRLVEEVGLGDDGRIAVEPIELEWDAGRLRYAEPWTWKIGGVPTRFFGSVEPDGSLALTWSVRVTKKTAKKIRALERFVGEEIEIPVRGTWRAPRLELAQALRALADRAVERTLRRETGGLLGGKEDPAEILSRADTLWKAGLKKKAQELYRKLREEYRLTPVYLLNRKRIDKRAEKKLDGP